MAVQAALDSAPDSAAKIKVLAQAAESFKAQAAAVKNPMSLEALGLFKMKAKCERRLAHELAASGQLKKVFRYKPDDLVWHDFRAEVPLTGPLPRLVSGVVNTFFQSEKAAP